ncbi:MAG: glycosyltransferase, partial [bacterium]
AAEDHQTLNAKRHAASGAARVLPEGELTPEKLAAWIRELAMDPGRLRAMAEAARGSPGAHARERIADACEVYLG